jgi:hypothetical protein
MLAILLLSACKKKDTASTRNSTSEIEVEIPETFIDFYKRFHEDSIFQMEHIVFPLPSKSDGSVYEQDEWIMNKAINLDGQGFKRDISNFQNIITEVIAHEQGLYTLERRFSPLGGGDWSLIYYKINNLMEDDWKKIEE